MQLLTASTCSYRVNTLTIMSTYLAPAPKASGFSLPNAPNLSLLPFALGPASTPFKTDSAPTAQFFRPRPCPTDVPGIPEGTTIAAFRGRQLVGQTISVPAGYRGYVISAPQPHQVDVAKWPLTPAPSVASTSTSRAGASASAAETSTQNGTRRSPRKSALANVADSIKAKVRGAGQVALSKPKTRVTRRDTVKRKRYQFGSDDDEDGDEYGQGQGQGKHVEHAAAESELIPGPKRSRAETPGDHSAVAAVDLPTIVVQEATPLKEPLPTPKKRLGQRGAVKEAMPGQRGRSRSPTVEAPSPSASAPEPASSAASTSSSTSTVVSENVIPSPATENDPPAFPVASVYTIVKAEEVDEPSDVAEPVPANARVLRPVSTFDSFTLWTPDGPLPGFKQDELDLVLNDEDKPQVKEETGGEEPKVETEIKTESVEEGVWLRRGWWRTGGAGEGGDEVVRALGEWIGLIEEVRSRSQSIPLLPRES